MNRIAIVLILTSCSVAVDGHDVATRSFTVGMSPSKLGELLVACIPEPPDNPVTANDERQTLQVRTDHQDYNLHIEARHYSIDPSAAECIEMSMKSVGALEQDSEGSDTGGSGTEP